MLRTFLGVTALAALLGLYWLNPQAAWVTLFSVFTLGVARYIRRRDDEAERAMQAVDR